MTRRVLILGANGLIGAEILSAVRTAGMTPVGLVRSASSASRLPRGIEARIADIAQLREAADWAPLIEGCDAVVNASGALQTGLRDNLAAVQAHAICALIEACELGGVKTFVQISAPGAEADASTEFMRTKAIADARLRKSALDWAIFKPGLVIARDAYGGTALIRMLAAFPLVQPMASGEARLQCVGAEEVAGAVVTALSGAVPMRNEYPLVEAEPHRLADIVLRFRSWLGRRPPLFVVTAPNILTRLIGLAADAAGWLGWRAPLRSTALRVLEADVVADAALWPAASGQRIRTLGEILAGMPATAQERLFARMQLLAPFLIVGLAGFFIASGVIGFARIDDAALVLRGVMNDATANFAVIGGAAADIALGAGLLFRRSARAAALGMAALSLAYLIAASVLTPALWSDPLGPLAKIIPAILASLTAAILLEER